MKIGDYRNAVAIYPRVLAAADATGEQVESWPSASGTHWGAIESPGGDLDPEPPHIAHDRLRLRFRKLVTLAAADRVTLKEFSQVYSVVGVWRERDPDNQTWQTVCDVVSVVLF